MFVRPMLELQTPVLNFQWTAHHNLGSNVEAVVRFTTILKQYYKSHSTCFITWMSSEELHRVPLNKDFEDEVQIQIHFDPDLQYKQILYWYHYMEVVQRRPQFHSSLQKE